jgi:hypothetical protein
MPRPPSSRTRPPRRRPLPSRMRPGPRRSPGSRPYGDLMKLKELFDASALTQAQLDTQKQKILAA